MSDEIEVTEKMLDAGGRVHMGVVKGSVLGISVGWNEFYAALYRAMEKARRDSIQSVFDSRTTDNKP